MAQREVGGDDVEVGVEGFADGQGAFLRDACDLADEHHPQVGRHGQLAHDALVWRHRAYARRYVLLPQNVFAIRTTHAKHGACNDESMELVCEACDDRAIPLNPDDVFPCAPEAPECRSGSHGVRHEGG